MRSVYDDDFISGRSIAKSAWLSVDAIICRTPASADLVCAMVSGQAGHMVLA